MILIFVSVIGNTVQMSYSQSFRMFVQPLYCGVLFDQGMMLNRRKDDSEDMKGVDEKVSLLMHGHTDSIHVKRFDVVHCH